MDIKKKKQSITQGALFTMLIPLVIIVNGGFFNMDLPQALASPLIAFFDMTPREVSNLYVAFSVPNFFFGPFSGFMIQTIGPANSTVILSMMCFIGMTGMYIALETNSYMYLLIGRAVFGAGAENLLIATMAAIGKWYFGKYLSLASGVTQSINMVVGAFGNFIAPFLFLYYRNVKISVFAGAISCFISFIAAALFSIIDAFYSDIYLSVEDEDNDKHDGIKEPVKITFTSIFKLGKLFWCMNFVYAILPNCYYQLTNMMTDLIELRYGYPYSEAKNFISEVQIITLLTIPFLSAIVTKIGKKSIIMVISAGILTCAYTIMAFLPNYPTIQFQATIFLFAAFYSLYTSCVWPSLSLSIPADAVGLGYGIATISQMTAFGGLPLIFGAVSAPRTKEAYQTCIWMLIGLSLLGLILTFITLTIDFAEGGLLHLPENSDKVRILRRRLNQGYRKMSVLELQSKSKLERPLV